MAYPAAMARSHGRERLRQLLRERNQWPSRAAEIDALIRRTFERKAAVLALDMCGFSRLTASRGICFYLSMIVQMEEAAAPAVANNGGRVFKQEADNLFAVFATPADALEAALDVAVAFRAVNSVMPNERDIAGSIGIGYGDLLVIPGEGAGEGNGLAGAQDVYGEEMNLACRLGEDAATGTEILLSPSAFAALPAGGYVLEPTNRNYHGTEVRCHRFVRRAVEESAPPGP
jgi:adenylate cyclase